MFSVRTPQLIYIIPAYDRTAPPACNVQFHCTSLEFNRKAVKPNLCKLYIDFFFCKFICLQYR